jgi:hypothetical protein
VHTFARDAVQPNPLVVRDKTLRTSERITIVTRDMDLNAPAPAESQGDYVVHYLPWPLVNTASWTMVGTDDLRFHVQVDHKWQEYADIGAWHAVLEDDQGHHYEPAAIEHARSKIIASTWDMEERLTACTNAGRTGEGYCYSDAGFFTNGWKEHLLWGSLMIYRGNADIVFKQPDLLTKNVRWLKLTMNHGTQRFEYVWKFDNSVASR